MKKFFALTVLAIVALVLFACGDARGPAENEPRAEHLANQTATAPRPVPAPTTDTAKPEHDHHAELVKHLQESWTSLAKSVLVEENSWKAELRGRKSSAANLCNASSDFGQAMEMHRYLEGDGAQLQAEVGIESAEFRKALLAAFRNYAAGLMEASREGVKEVQCGEVGLPIGSSLDQLVDEMIDTEVSPDQLGLKVADIRNAQVASVKREVPELLARTAEGSADAQAALDSYLEKFSAEELGISDAELKKFRNSPLAGH